MIESPIKVTDELLKEHFPIPAVGDASKVRLEELFKAVMAEIKETAQGALGYQQICEPLQAVRRLAQDFKDAQAKIAELQLVIDANRWPDTAAKIQREIEAELANTRFVMDKRGDEVELLRARLGDALIAFQAIEWMAHNYADKSGSEAWNAYQKAKALYEKAQAAAA